MTTEVVRILRFKPKSNKQLELIQIPTKDLPRILCKDPDYEVKKVLCNFSPEYGDYLRLSVVLNAVNELIPGVWTALIIDAHDGSTRLEQEYLGVIILGEVYQHLITTAPDAIFER